MSNQTSSNPFVTKNATCDNFCYDKISPRSSFPKFDDLTHCDDKCSVGCYSEDKYSESEEVCTQKTVNDKSTGSCCPKPKKACCKECEIEPCDPCEPICKATCDKLVKRYECSRKELLAYADIITMLTFLKSKMISVQPNLGTTRNIEAYNKVQNIAWLECFVDTLFCVLEKNKTYGAINVKVCKLKNTGSINRTYVIEICYTTTCDKVTVKIPLYFRWTQLTNNTPRAYNGVLNYVVNQLNDEIKKFQALATIPFLCCN